MSEPTDEVSKDVLRDIFYIWFYVTVTHLDDIRPKDPTKLVSAEALIKNLEQEGAQSIAMNADQTMTQQNTETFNHFYDAVKNNKGFGNVRDALTKDNRLFTFWTGGLHPTPKELNSVFSTPGK